MEKKKKTKNKKRFTWVNLAQLLTVAALLLWMQWAVDSGRVLTIFVASPTSIVEEGIKIITDGTLWPHLLLTIQEALAGYLSAVVVGIAVGLIWTLFPVSEKYMNVFCSAIMAVPKVAILPLLILWFGIGEMSKVFIIIIGTFVPCLLNAYNGVRLVDPDLYDVIRVLGGKRRDEIFHVCFPASFPAVFAGLQISLSSAWTCVLAAELMNSRDGMGFLIKRGMDTHQPTLVLGGMVLIAAAAYGTSLLVTLFEGKLCPWKRTIENL